MCHRDTGYAVVQFSISFPGDQDRVQEVREKDLV